jgi:outer membrane protein OmpA-like peptidoglycan-associated protein
VKIATVLRGAAAATAAAVLAACATAPERNTSLEQARSAYDAAQSNPHVPRFAPGELNEAAQALNRAEAMWRNEADAERLEHAAYLATQRAHLARETAMIRAADAELARAGGERERTVLAARLRAAEAARDQAAAQAQEAERERIAALERVRQAEEQRRSDAMAEQQDAKRRLGAEVQRLQSQIADLKARESARGWILSLGGDVLFESGQASLKPGGLRAVDQLAQYLRQHPGRDIVVEGFTDSVGSSEMNQRLSEQRAQAVKRALLSRGVPESRVQTRGHGESYFIASNDTAAGRQLNRRVEFILEAAPTAAAGSSAAATR